MEAEAASPPRVLRADARRNRERILAAAREAFAEHGAEAQIDEVARRAGVGVGTVYRHFPTKEELLGELVAERFRAFAAAAREALDGDGDAWEAFAGVLRRNAEMVARDVGVQHALARSPEAWAAAEPERRALRAVGAELVERAHAAGVLRPDFTVDDLPMLMCGLSSTMSIDSYDWRRHLEILLAGLRAAPQPSPR
jgi:AcrR family transcriptional regulator